MLGWSEGIRDLNEANTLLLHLGWDLTPLMRETARLRKPFGVSPESSSVKISIVWQLGIESSSRDILTLENIEVEHIHIGSWVQAEITLSGAEFYREIRR